MTALYQSPFLLALGWAIVASLWQVAVLWLLYQVIAHRNSSPVVKHNFSFVMLIAASAWFAYTFIQKYNTFSTLDLTSATAAFDGNAGIAMPLLQTDIFSLFSLFLPYFSTAYLVVFLLLTLRLAKAYGHSRKLQTTGLIPIDYVWIDRVERYANRLGIVQQVRIYLSEYIDVPATLNYFKPVILIPVAAFNRLTPEQVESVILHEMAHIKRKDYLVNIFVSVMEILLFFNPFVHLLATSLRKERENCCDDFVLQFRFDPHSYASALLSLEQLRVNRLPATVLAATGQKNQLLGRVKRIMNVNNNNLNYGQRLLALFVITFLLISVAWLTPEKRPSDEVATEVQPAAIEEKIEKNVTQTTSQPINNTIQRSGKVEPTKPELTEIMEEDRSAVRPAPPIPPTPPVYDEVYSTDNLESPKDLFSTGDAMVVWAEGLYNKLHDVENILNVLTTNEDGKKALNMLQEKFLVTKDSMANIFRNQDQQTHQKMAKTKKAPTLKQEEAKQHWTFSYDSIMNQVLQFDGKRKQQPAQQKTLSIPRRDTIHIKTTAPAKAKKTIWVNHFNVDSKKTLAITLDGKLETLAETIAEKIQKSETETRSLIAEFSGGKDAFVISFN